MEKIVKDWENYFLRNDEDIIKDDPNYELDEERYSLFCKNPYGRVEIFRGSKDWALKMSEEHLLNNTD